MFDGLEMNYDILNLQQLSINQRCYLAVIDNLEYENSTTTSLDISSEMDLLPCSVRVACDKLTELKYLQKGRIQLQGLANKPYYTYILADKPKSNDYLWIPDVIWRNEDMCSGEKVFLAEMIRLADDNIVETATYYAKTLGLTKINTYLIAKLLNEKGLISREGNNKTVYYVLSDNSKGKYM